MKIKANSTLEDILGIAGLAIVAGGIYVDMHVFNGNGSAGFSGGLLCSGAIGYMYSKIVYDKKD